MDALLQTLKRHMESLSGGQRIVLLSMVAAFAVSGLVFSLWLRNPEMAVLTSEADMARAGEIVNALAARGVDYEVTHGGRTIMVERQMASELAVTLAAEGLIGDASGGRILDSKNVGMWPSEILRDNIRRVLQAELAHMITGLRSVESAQVQLALPEESVFTEDEQKPSASVLVRLRAGGNLSAIQVRGIANLVSAGVEGLDPMSVSVVDQDGTVLWGDEADEDAASMARLQKKKEIERHLADKATAILTRVVGRANAIVTIDADLSWNQTETTRKSFDPERSSVRSEQRDETTTDGNSAESSVTNYEIDETQEYILSKGARLEHMTASVAVNYRDVIDGQGNVTHERIPQNELDELRTLVQNAVGFDETRGDRITVVNQQFTEGEPLVSGGGFFSSTIFQQLPGLLGKLIAVAITVFLLMNVRKQLSTPFGGPGAGGGGDILSSGAAGTGGVGMAGAVRNVAQERFQSLAEGNPENVARVMKSWMTDSGSAAGS